jgi:DNA-binding response OmpR family regulator
LKTVLVVDDDPELREALCSILSEPGYTVLSASNGYEALGVLVERVVDLLITDVRMPGLSGFEFARQAKLMRPYLHIIYLSGHDSDAERYVGPTYGRLIRKPVRADELLHEVEHELRP